MGRRPRVARGSVVRYIRQEIGAAFDRVLARIGIRILDRLFGLCEPPHDPDCTSCLAARLAEKMRVILEPDW